MGIAASVKSQPLSLTSFNSFSPQSPLSSSSSSSFSHSLQAKYSLHAICGRSTTATVFSATRRDQNRQVAIKQINLKKILDMTHRVDLVISELFILKTIQHEFIVKLYSAFRMNSFCYLVLDCLTGGDLRDHIRFGDALTEKSIAYILSCIGSALHHMHFHKILHRDVKPENIVFDQFYHPKLVDFGISQHSTSYIPISTSTSGTLPYVAPEVLAHDHYHSTQADFWSLGLIGYELVYTKLPFKKHCPEDFVSYVYNKYQHMWSQVIRCNSSTTYEDSLNPFAESMIDSDLELSSISTVPHIPLPLFRFLDGALVTNECASLLAGLLTLNIPERLGSSNEFFLFSDHSLFQFHGYNCSSSLLAEMESPLLFEHPYFWRMKSIEKTDINDLNSNELIELSAELEEKLKLYEYDHEKLTRVSRASDSSHFEDRRDRISDQDTEGSSVQTKRDDHQNQSQILSNLTSSLSVGISQR